jgi:ceramide glucosyltransferase
MAALPMLRLVATFAAGVLCLTAIGYYTLALQSARDFFRRRPPGPRPLRLPISILKPICGLDRGAYENFASFCRQRYPEFQILFGCEDEGDPGLTIARQIVRDFPKLDIRIVVSRGRETANPKVGLLAAMAAEARHPLLLVSDSDIRVGPQHLRHLVEPMSDARVAVVTCLYRSHAEGFAACFDALGLSTDFQPSVLVARMLEGISFGMGSGVLVRRTALAEAGGFAAIAQYLADDYLLGNLPVRAGHRAELAADVVEHELGTTSLAGAVDHQVRWNRGIRAMRPRGYAGLIFTHGTPASLALLALAAATPAAWALAAMTLSMRLAVAWYVAVRCLRDGVARRAFWLVPLRDVAGFALWVAGFFGNTVVWRGRKLRLAAGGRIEMPPEAAQPDSDLTRTGIAS